jgi:hypothetical protein
MIPRGSFFFWDEKICVKIGGWKFLCVRENKIYTITNMKKLANANFYNAVLTEINNQCQKLN